MYFVLGLITAVLGVLPLIFTGRFKLAVILGIGLTLLTSGFYWLVNPSLAYPLGGLIGVVVLITWIVSAVVPMFEDKFEVPSVVLAILGLLAFVCIGISGWTMFRSNDYASLIGTVERRVWTQDVQPKDPGHVRLVPEVAANWKSDTQLGKGQNVLGSQFRLAHDYTTLQRIKNGLFYVTPMDFAGFFTWNATGTAPGYVMVSAEDPNAEVVMVTNAKFVYMPGAFFDKDLDRHLWTHGYSGKGITDRSFEIDDQGHAWWVVTVFRPTIAWSGPKVEGVVIVDPTTGDIKDYPLGKVPQWVDRVYPGGFIAGYIDDWGMLSGGWSNSWIGKKNLIVGETPSISYGADGDCYWVTCLTSPNRSDEALIDIMYTDSRTGKTTIYSASGGTEVKIVSTVDGKVGYRKLHGDSPVIYNIFGVMTALVPLIAENGSFTGLSIVNVERLTSVEDENVGKAFDLYRESLNQSGQQIVADREHERVHIAAVVNRFATDITRTETVYYLTINGEAKIFIGNATLSAKLPLTRPGDLVTIEYIRAASSKIPMMAFDNTAIKVDSSSTEASVNQTRTARQASVDRERNVRTDLDNLSDLSPEELRQLAHIRDSLATTRGKK